MKEKTIERIRKFTEDRDWDQFHSPANLAKSIVIDTQNLLDKLELDADEIVNMKMKQNEAKYPVDKAKGNAVKYTEL